MEPEPVLPHRLPGRKAITAVASACIMLLSGGGPLTACAGEGAGEPAACLIVVSIDTLRADHVSCCGYSAATTPCIDVLAGQGHLFSNGYTPMPTTLPAHASLMTSLYPSQLNTRRNGDQVPSRAVTLAEILKARGYATGAFVSASVLDARYGLCQGFDAYDGPGAKAERPAEETAFEAAAWLAENASRKFFLFVHLYDPHTFYYAPPAFRQRFQAPDTPEPSPPSGCSSVTEACFPLRL